MKNVLKKILTQLIGGSLSLVFFIIFPTQAATFEIKNEKEMGVKYFHQNEDFYQIESQESAQQQANKQVKSNYQRVLRLIKQKQYKEANKKVNALIQQSPNQAVYYNLKAVLQLLKKDSAGAEKSFLKAVKLNTSDTQALIGLAKLSLDNKQVELAKQYANRALKINVYQAKAYQILAGITLKQQGIEAVETLLLKALNKVKNNTNTELEILQLLGKVYITKKQPKRLLHLATDFMERNQNQKSALSFLFEAQLANQDQISAEKTIRQIIAEHPKDAKHLVLLARLLATQKDKETETLNLLDKAIISSGNPTLVLSYKAAFLIKQQQFQRAFSIAQQIDKLNPLQSMGKILKGDIYLAEKEYQKAQQYYQQAYKINSNIQVLDKLLKILTLQNKLEDTVILLVQELKKNTDNSTIQLRLAVAYQTQGQYDLSIKYYEALLTKQKDNAIVLNNLAWIYSQQNNAKAIKLAEQAYKLAPGSSAIADTYGHILFKNGYKQESLKVLKRANELDSESAEILLHLAEAYIGNQQKPKARIILQKLLNNEAIEKKQVLKLMDKL